MNKAERHGVEFFEVSAIYNTDIDAAMNALARQMCLKYESLAGDFNAFNDAARMSFSSDTHGKGFKLIGNNGKIVGGGGFGCCGSREDGDENGGCNC